MFHSARGNRNTNINNATTHGYYSRNVLDDGHGVDRNISY
jgi:hypothetical protein